MTKLFKITGWVLAVLIPACGVFYVVFEPDLDDELIRLKVGRSYCYSGAITNSSIWKHADKLVFKGTFENGRIDSFKIHPSGDTFERKPIIEAPSKHSAEFSLTRLSKQETCTIEIIVNCAKDLKEDIRMNWGARKTKKVVSRQPGERELRIFNIALSMKEREQALKSNAGKIR